MFVICRIQPVDKCELILVSVVSSDKQQQQQQSLPRVSVCDSSVDNNDIIHFLLILLF
jgi:hypothetical protein